MARGTSRVRLDADLKGPFWKSPGAVARQEIEKVQVVTAYQAEADVRSFLGAHIQHGTGAYLSGVHVGQRASFQLVADNGATYGPWLEAGRTMGPGHTPRTTRFKGYHAFRRTRQKVARWLRTNAEGSVSRLVDRLG